MHFSHLQFNGALVNIRKISEITGKPGPQPGIFNRSITSICYCR